MKDATSFAVPDYLVIGHVALDLTPQGPALGGTAAYAGLTAEALGLRVAVITSVGPEISLEPLSSLKIHNIPAPHSTTFENVYTPAGRSQRIHHIARTLGGGSLRDAWRRARVVHLAPIAGEIDAHIVAAIGSDFIGVTPQGWMRRWNQVGEVRPDVWDAPNELLESAAALVLSVEDIGGDEDRIRALARRARLLAVTEGASGARVFWRDEIRRYDAPEMHTVDPTGAGDIFAACFFVRLYHTRDPWEAGRFATQLSANSVGRQGISSVPTRQEIETALEPRDK
jgi:sugar/nucleoside kinase (ribokinase family)